ncbi:MAG: hypothetical protein MJ188_08090 [Treponema sp.]|nr:hypothetical protein [Treponema sp.]
MSDEINRTADWEPGTLEKTRRNIGNIDQAEAAEMAKKLGGQVLYEKTSSSSLNGNGGSKNGRIVRSSSSDGNAGNNASSNNASSGGGNSSNSLDFSSENRRHAHEELPVISKKENALMDKLMMSPDYKIKPNYGVFNFLRSLSKNGAERVSPEFYEFTIKKDIEHFENFITVIKTLIQISPSTYKAKIVNGSETKFKFLRTIASWSVQPIKFEYTAIQSAQNQVVVSDLIPLIRAIYKPLITIYYYGNNKIPKVIKEIYSDELAYQDAPQEKLSSIAKQAITDWLFIDTEIIKKLHPLLMRMCSDTFENYPDFFSVRASEILKFTGLHKFDLLLPEKDKPAEEKKEKPKSSPPQKGIKDATVVTGLKLLDQLFPKAGFDRLDEHPDMFPYFQPLYKFVDGFNMLSPDNPVQVIMILQRIIEDCFQGCRYIKFAVAESNKQGADSFSSIMDEWSAYREDTFERLYCEPLKDLTNTVYSQPDFPKSRMGKKIITSLLWQTTYHFMPNFKFDQLLLEHPTDESKYRPLFHRTDFARKYLTLIINECDSKQSSHGTVQSVSNPWDHYKFDIQNEVSKRLDVLLGAQNKTANTNANNANLLKYTLCFISVLDWWINNPGSPAYTTDPMNIYRISPSDGKPQFSVPQRSDQNSLFVEAVKANYQKKAQ